MADKKISQLTAATTPLAGTEVLPIVQGGSTVKVSVDNLTAGKTVKATTFDTDVAAAKVTLTGTTLAASGTDSNINVTVTPKGTGSLSTTKLSASGDVSFDGGTFVFNESGADKDFRVEGDNSAYLLYTDASTDQIGLNTSAPIRLLTLGGGKDVMLLNTAGDGATNTTLGRISSNVRTYGGNIGTASFATVEFATDAAEWFKGELRFLTNGTDGTDGAGTVRMKIGASGDITASTGNLIMGTADKGLADSAGNLKLAINTTSVNAQSVLSGGLTNRKGSYTPGTTTPSVTGVSHLVITNSSATSITNFTGSVEGQLLFLKFNDANTTITRNNAYLAGAANFTSATNATLVLISDGTAWFEVCRSTTNG